MDPSGLKLSRLFAASPADFGRGRRLGLNRARLAFVGERKEARLGVVWVPSRVNGRSGRADGLIGIEVVGESLRRLEGELSIACWTCYNLSLRLRSRCAPWDMIC